ncbi:protein FAM210B, mitochondrial-like [Diabrotica undecimpunctata]|uniref:protein FAM210B, mitochondrial-like n=1 Tax=Diabrotica undecimpunctata TaxID=50387 RepID=UPI003B63AD67
MRSIINIRARTLNKLVNRFDVTNKVNILGNYNCYNEPFYQTYSCLTPRSVIFYRPAIYQSCRFQSTDIKEAAKDDTKKSEKELPEKIIVKETLSRKEKLKKAVKEYGSTVIVFHIGISLISLGTSYLLVSFGLDVAALFQAVGLEEWIKNSNVATNAGTFAVAYALHKVFAPVRITITLASVPLIVRYLRKVGFLKK